jgi:hypothetical protein
MCSLSNYGNYFKAIEVNLLLLIYLYYSNFINRFIFFFILEFNLQIFIFSYYNLLVQKLDKTHLLIKSFLIKKAI